jgi:hypothetical protein
VIGLGLFLVVIGCSLRAALKAARGFEARGRPNLGNRGEGCLRGDRRSACSGLLRHARVAPGVLVGTGARPRSAGGVTRRRKPAERRNAGFGGSSVERAQNPSGEPVYQAFTKSKIRLDARDTIAYSWWWRQSGGVFAR